MHFGEDVGDKSYVGNVALLLLDEEGLADDGLGDFVPKGGLQVAVCKGNETHVQVLGVHGRSLLDESSSELIPGERGHTTV